MLARLLLASVGLLAAAVMGGGCALRPDHVTLYAEHNEAETTGGPRGTSTTGNKVGVSASYDLLNHSR